jgi:membrane associated rhomboid family serine protease
MAPTAEPPAAPIRTAAILARFSRWRPLPLALVVVQLGVFVAFATLAPRGADGSVLPIALLLAGAKVNGLVEAGEWWRLLSSELLHANTTHLFVNSAGAWLLAQLCDGLLGWGRTIVVYVAGAVGASLLSLTLCATPSVGASGAVYALLGASAAFIGMRLGALSLRARLVLLGAGLAWIAASLGVAPDTTDWASHLGGLLAGAVLGPVLGRGLPLYPIAPPRTSRFLAMAAGVCLVLVAGALVQSWRGLTLRIDPPRYALRDLNLPAWVVPVPSEWAPGRLDGESCEPEDGDSLDSILRAGVLCLRDPFGTTLLIGRVEDLGAGFVFDASMTFESGLRVPVRQVDGNLTRRILLVDRRWMLALVSYEIIGGWYDDVLARITAGIRKRS